MKKFQFFKKENFIRSIVNLLASRRPKILMSFSATLLSIGPKLPRRPTETVWPLPLVLTFTAIRVCRNGGGHRVYSTTDSQP